MRVLQTANTMQETTMQKLTLDTTAAQAAIILTGAGAQVSKKAKVTHESGLILKNVKRLYTAQGATLEQVLATAGGQAQIDRSNAIRTIELADFIAIHGLTQKEVDAALKTESKTIDFSARDFVDRVSLVNASAKVEAPKTVDEFAAMVVREHDKLVAAGRTEEAAAYKTQFPGAFTS